MIAVAGVLPLLTPALLLVRDAPSISVVAGVLSVAEPSSVASNPAAVACLLSSWYV
jgi:hypothetical protein